MLRFLQPLGAVLVGLALSVYGLIHSLLHPPPAATFRRVAEAVPATLTVLVFFACLMAVVTGVVLLAIGVRGVRRRAHDIRRAYGRPRPRPRNSPVYDDEWDHPAVVR